MTNKTTHGAERIPQVLQPSLQQDVADQKQQEGVLIAIQPRWCELIAEGKKLVEVRKTSPKLFGKFKCFIYCTVKGKTYLPQGKVIGEFICNHVGIYGYEPNGSLVNENKVLEQSCLTKDELYNYLNGKPAHVIYISDLVIYDKPRELKEFGLSRPPQSWCYVKEKINE